MEKMFPGIRIPLLPMIISAELLATIMGRTIMKKITGPFILPFGMKVLGRSSGPGEQHQAERYGRDFLQMKMAST